MGDRSGGVRQLVVRWLWRVDDVANQLTLVTGRWCAAAIRWDMRRRRRGEP